MQRASADYFVRFDGAATPLCGFQNPEDLALLPGGRHMLVSEHGDSGQRAGRISLLDLESNEHTSLFAGAQPAAPGPWGAPDCAGPPSAAFSPHGIHLAQRADGALQLLVVNHGGRESVEMFEVTRGEERWQLTWRGCAETPDDLLNDVVALPEGGFLATRFAPKSTLSLLFSLSRSMLFGRYREIAAKLSLSSMSQHRVNLELDKCQIVRSSARRRRHSTHRTLRA